MFWLNNWHAFVYILFKNNIMQLPENNDNIKPDLKHDNMEYSAATSGDDNMDMAEILEEEDGDVTADELDALEDDSFDDQGEALNAVETDSLADEDNFINDTNVEEEYPDDAGEDTGKPDHHRK
jgi:hypothetical protein